MKRLKKTVKRKPVDADLVVGANLRKLRNERQVTLSELSGALGMSHQQLQKYETGANRVSAGVLFHMARYFAVPIEALYEDEDSSSSSETSEISRAQSKCRAIVDRTSSIESLAQMAIVLRAMSADKG